jgi:hypothetical protein
MSNLQRHAAATVTTVPVTHCVTRLTRLPEVSKVGWMSTGTARYAGQTLWTGRVLSSEPERNLNGICFASCGSRSLGDAQESDNMIRVFAGSCLIFIARKFTYLRSKKMMLRMKWNCCHVRTSWRVCFCARCWPRAGSEKKQKRSDTWCNTIMIIITIQLNTVKWVGDSDKSVGTPTARAHTQTQT